jgi:hypothetical protein
VEIIAQQRDQIAKHVAGARKAVKQQKLWRAFAACLPIENLKAIYIGRLVCDY